MKIGSLAEGELYFIGEVDPSTGKSTPYTKIGIVREQRVSGKRLTEHQTGNPRQLVVVDQIKAPIVERIETALHHIYAPSRLSGEWFHFASKEQIDAIRNAKSLSAEAIEASPMIALATKLQKVSSNGSVLEPSKDILDAYSFITYLRQVKSSTDHIEKLVKTALATATKSGLATSGFFSLQEKRESESFDEESLKTAHPKLWARYVTESKEITSKFTLAKHLSESAGFSDDRAAAAEDLVGSTESLARAAASNEGALAGLHDGYLQMLTILGSVQWQIDLVEARLKAMCGEADEIRGVCKWSRTEKSKEKFDKTKFKKDNPEVYKEFVTMKKSSPSSVIRRDRGFRL